MLDKLVSNGTYTLKEMKQLTELKTKKDVSALLTEKDYLFTYNPKISSYIIIGQPQEIKTIYDVTEDSVLTREQIGMLIGCEPSNSNYNARMKSFFNKYGIEYEWHNKQGATILSIDHSYIEAKDLLTQKFGLNEQVNAKAYLLFLYLMCVDEEFQSSTWDWRVNIFRNDYNIDIKAPTFSKWVRKMIEMDIFQRDKTTKNPWVTIVSCGTKAQRPVNLTNEKEIEEMSNYIQRRRELLAEADEKYNEACGTVGQKNPSRWSIASTTLKQEYGSKYYYAISPFVYNKHFIDEDMQKLFDLAQNIFDNIPRYDEIETRKYEKREPIYQCQSEDGKFIF